MTGQTGAGTGLAAPMPPCHATRARPCSTTGEHARKSSPCPKAGTGDGQSRTAGLSEIGGTGDRFLNHAVSLCRKTKKPAFSRQTEKEKTYRAGRIAEETPFLPAPEGHGMAPDELVVRTIAGRRTFSALSGSLIGRRL
ncbi:hypothetical protein [Oxalobacter paraformigenes]|uniref:hypothetical protein n=1 Tax=Oxalobacter paraformigenes TaxID=556268 RepID=UPI000304F74C|nr:hypothetical protein [Oxalobacter paraformigenes]